MKGGRGREEKGEMQGKIKGEAKGMGRHTNGKGKTEIIVTYSNDRKIKTIQKRKRRHKKKKKKKKKKIKYKEETNLNEGGCG